MAYKYFATDKLNFNVVLSGQTFSKDGDGNLIITETFQTTLTPEQVAVLKDSYEKDLAAEQAVDTDKINTIQSDLSAIDQTLNS